jgi:hypothetical protein
MAKPKRRPARGKLVRRKLVPPPVPGPFLPPNQVVAARELFWHNVIREILTSLSTLCALRSDEPAARAPANEHAEETAADKAASASDAAAYDPTLFDGRLAVMTKAGERVAIADVFPLFACGINSPGGHVYTLPLHEIRAFHALTPELMRRLERIARRKRGATGEPGGDQTPFGFAAFTSMIQGPTRPIEPAPSQPTE